MHKPSTRKIPLRNRAKQIIAYALVDDDDYERVVAMGSWSINQHRNNVVYKRVAVGGGKEEEVKLHRFIMGVAKGDPIVDHINRNPLDNRKENLRLVTHQQNTQNRVGLRQASSQYRGVFWDRGVSKWRAQHTLNNKTIYIGIFLDELEAAEAARKWREEFMPFADQESLYPRA